MEHMALAPNFISLSTGGLRRHGSRGGVHWEGLAIELAIPSTAAICNACL
jgi:hypothetical protein